MDGHASFRRAQYLTAIGKPPVMNAAGDVVVPGMPPNPTMLIWMGKQHLDQKDKSDVTTETHFTIDGFEGV
jgi:hypothetical protein